MVLQDPCMVKKLHHHYCSFHVKLAGSTHFLTHSLTFHSLAFSLAHKLAHSRIRSLTHSPIHTHLLTPFVPPSLPPPLPPSLTHSLTYSLTGTGYRIKCFCLILNTSVGWWAGILALCSRVGSWDSRVRILIFAKDDMYSLFDSKSLPSASASKLKQQICIEYIYKFHVIMKQ